MVYFSAIHLFWSTNERNTHKLKSLFWGIRYRHWITTLVSSMEQRCIRYVLTLHPYLLFMCRLKAYVIKEVSPEFTQQRLLGHYSFLHQKVGEQGVRAIHGQGLKIGETTIAGKPVELILYYNHLMRYEGQCTLKFLVGGDIFYQAHLHFFDNALWIGGFQGRSGNLEEARKFTKDTFGLRPHNFMYLMLTVLARKFGVQHIYAISGTHHYYQKEEKTLNKIRFDYDQFWEELGGQAGDDGVWVSLPLIYPRKTPEEIPGKKRSQYNHRYALMDTIEQDMLSPEQTLITAQKQSPLAG